MDVVGDGDTVLKERLDALAFESHFAGAGVVIAEDLVDDAGFCRALFLNQNNPEGRVILAAAALESDSKHFVKIPPYGSDGGTLTDLINMVKWAIFRADSTLEQEDHLEFFEKIDLYIVDRAFQPVADWWQRLTHKNNFWLTRMCGWCYLILFGLAVVTNKDTSNLPSEIIAGIALSALVLLYIKGSERLERKADENALQTKLNAERLFYPYGMIRLFAFAFCTSVVPANIIEFHGMSLSDLSMFLWDISVVLLVCMFYFSACTPKQPPLLHADTLQAVRGSV